MLQFYDDFGQGLLNFVLNPYLGKCGCSLSGIDCCRLWKQFDVMEEDEEKAFGAGLDMSPHYRSFLQQNYTK